MRDFALESRSLTFPSDGGWVIAPRIPLKTLIVERGVVVVGSTGQIRIEHPTGGTNDKLPRATSASEGEFFEQMEQGRPGLAEQAKSFIEGLVEFDISPEFRKSLVLRWHPTPDFVGSLGYIEPSGKVWTGD